MPDETTRQTDHDAIVTLISEVRQITKAIDGLKIDIRDIKDDLAGRITNLESTKAEKVDQEELMKDIAWLQKTVWGGLGLLAAVEFYFMYIHK